MRRTSTARQDEIRGRAVRDRGSWGEVWEQILAFDPELLSAYLDFSAVPRRKPDLDAKTRELIALAVDVSVTHLYVPGIREHVRAALDRGATPEQVMDVVALTTTLGIHAVNVAVPLLAGVLEEEGLRTGPATLDDYRRRLKDEFVERRGYWADIWDETLELDPELFEAYTSFSSTAGRGGALEPAVRELVCLAFNASTTHLYAPSIRLHIENAIGLGASVGAVLETLEIASLVGFQSALVAVPILAEELDRRGETS